MTNFADTGVVGAVVGCNTHIIAGRGKNLATRQAQALSCETPDLASAGLPCQPWTRGRHKGGTTAHSLGPEKHPGFQVLSYFKEF